MKHRIELDPYRRPESLQVMGTIWNYPTRHYVEIRVELKNTNTAEAGDLAERVKTFINEQADIDVRKVDVTVVVEAS